MNMIIVPWAHYYLYERNIVETTPFTDLTPRVPPPWPFDEAGALNMESGIHQEPEDAKHADIVLRFLTENDLDRLFETHLEIIQTLSHPHLLRPDAKEFMAAHLTRRGRTIGAFAGDRLVGYAVVSFPMRDSDNLGSSAGLSAEEKLRVAHFDGTGVVKQYRGRRIPRFMNKFRAGYAACTGYTHLMVTCAPMNIPNLKNLMAVGFGVVDFTVKYGGMDRLVAYCNLQRPFSVQEENMAHHVSIKDRDGLKAAIDEKRLGLALGEKHGETTIVFTEANTAQNL